MIGKLIMSRRIVAWLLFVLGIFEQQDFFIGYTMQQQGFVTCRAGRRFWVVVWQQLQDDVTGLLVPEPHLVIDHIGHLPRPLTMEDDSKKSFNGSPIWENLREVGTTTNCKAKREKHAKFKRARERAVISFLPTWLLRWLHLFFGVKNPLRAPKVHFLPY